MDGGNANGEKVTTKSGHISDVEYEPQKPQLEDDLPPTDQEELDKLDASVDKKKGLKLLATPSGKIRDRSQPCRTRSAEPLGKASRAGALFIQLSMQTHQQLWRRFKLPTCVCPRKAGAQSDTNPSTARAPQCLFSIFGLFWPRQQADFTTILGSLWLADVGCLAYPKP